MSAAAMADRRRWITGRLVNAAKVSVLPLASLLVALVLGAIVLGIAGEPVFEAYKALVRGAFGSKPSIQETLMTATPLMLVGLGVTFALKAQFFNIGGMGQLYLGAIAATEVGLLLSGGPAVLTIALALVAAFIVGGLWAVPTAVWKIRRGTNEIITTILMNYVGAGIVSWLIYGPLRDSDDAASILPQSGQLDEGVRLPVVDFIVPAPLGFWIAVAAGVVVYLILYRTVLGFDIRVAGSSPGTGRYTGLPSSRLVLSAVFISGGLAGIAGAVEIFGHLFRVTENFLPEVAFTGVAVALLGRTRPLGVIIAAIVIGGLFTGGETMETSVGLSSTVVYILEALILLCVTAGMYMPAIRASTRLRRLLSRPATPPASPLAAGAEEAHEVARR